jgi:hypothetical protein
MGINFYRKPQIVDFYTFKIDYWGAFPKGLTKPFAVELVFSEIMGVIKGSVSSRTSLQPLSREEYLTKSCRLAPIFTTDWERNKVYDLYEKYEGKKKGYGDRDYVDRVVCLLRALLDNKFLRNGLNLTFDEVYVDGKDQVLS